MLTSVHSGIFLSISESTLNIISLVLQIKLIQVQVDHFNLQKCIVQILGYFNPEKTRIEAIYDFHNVSLEW